MNRFLTSQSIGSEQSSGDNSAIDALLTRIQVLEDVSYYEPSTKSAYYQMARRKLVSDGIVYPDWCRIGNATHVLDAAGGVVSRAGALNDACWRLVPLGGSVYIISSGTGVDLAQVNGLSQLQVITVDGGATYTLATQPGPAVWNGTFLEMASGATLLASAYTSTADLRSANRWSITPFIRLTASELTYELFQLTFPSVTDGVYEFEMWSYDSPGYYVTQKDLATYKHFLGIQASNSVVGTYPVVT